LSYLTSRLQHPERQCIDACVFVLTDCMMPDSEEELVRRGREIFNSIGDDSIVRYGVTETDG
jgi:hypothetical protein